MIMSKSIYARLCNYKRAVIKSLKEMHWDVDFISCTSTIHKDPNINGTRFFALDRKGDSLNNRWQQKYVEVAQENEINVVSSAKSPSWLVR
jgi:hypothetical protein